MKSGHNNTINFYFKRAKTRFPFYLFLLIVSIGAENKFCGSALILYSFPICPQSLLSLISDDISRSENGKGQISIKIVCR